MTNVACLRRPANGSVPGELSAPRETDFQRDGTRVSFLKVTIMHPGWSAFRARVANRLARHLYPARFQLQTTTPMVSFTFDDAPKSAATIGAPILEEYDARGTFYISGGLVDKWSGNWTGVSADDILGLHHRGHELACHTFSHARAIDLDAAAMAAETEKNR